MDAWHGCLRSCCSTRRGYEVGRYISLETAIEQTKEGYYDALSASSTGWHEGHHTLGPWWEYFVGVMLVKAYREFEDRVGATGARRGAKRDMIRDVVSRLPDRVPIRGSRTRPASGQSAHDCARASRTERARNRAMRRAGTRCDVGKNDSIALRLSRGMPRVVLGDDRRDRDPEATQARDPSHLAGIGRDSLAPRSQATRGARTKSGPVRRGADGTPG